MTLPIRSKSPIYNDLQRFPTATSPVPISCPPVGSQATPGTPVNRFPQAIWFDNAGKRVSATATPLCHSGSLWPPVVRLQPFPSVPSWHTSPTLQSRSHPVNATASSGPPNRTSTPTPNNSAAVPAPGWSGGKEFAVPQAASAELSHAQRRCSRTRRASQGRGLGSRVGTKPFRRMSGCSPGGSRWPRFPYCTKGQ
jgi:hypothetical protein